MALCSAIRVLGVLAFLCASLSPLWSQSAPDERVEALYSEARSAAAANDFPVATAKYQEIIKLAPRLGPAYNNLGALYFKQGRYREAVDVLQRGLKVDPSMSSASALLGISLFQMAEYREPVPIWKPRSRQI
ncbi:MAG: tetratricopeptide repeat protein [Bryobacteraceae bacterium]